MKYSAKAWSPDVIGVKPEDIIPDALILAVTHKAGEVEGDEPAVRVRNFELDDDFTYVPEGKDFNEKEPELAETVIHTAKICTSVERGRIFGQCNGHVAQLRRFARY